jgi:2-oxoisovalerate dehydrogenase E1 component
MPACERLRRPTRSHAPSAPTPERGGEEVARGVGPGAAVGYRLPLATRPSALTPHSRRSLSINRVAVVESRLDLLLETSAAAARALAPDERLAPGRGPTARQAVALFEDQVASRALDVAARDLKKSGASFYTISSAGHEQNGVLGTLLRTNDPCFLHYRSGAFMMARLRQVPDATPIFDTALSLCASSEDPVSGGRHKVWGSNAAWIPPQTSTIASHLPKALGTAFALARTRATGIEPTVPRDGIVACSFGDASANHATALAGVNSARYSFRKGNPTPILFVCEDNRIGISVETPRTWIRDHFGHLEHLRYVPAEGDLIEVWDAIDRAVRTCRNLRAPVFLHLHTVRLWGHAGSDVETTYRSLEEIEAIEDQDPILANAKTLIETGAATPEALRALVRDVRARVRAAAAEASGRPKLDSRADVIAPLAPHRPDAVRAAHVVANDARRTEVFGRTLPEARASATQHTLAAHINAALIDVFAARRETIAFGEDVGKKGGVYGVTKDLQKTFGQTRVFDTLLDETTILGLAQGAAHLGLLPVPEIQYLAYLHNAIDQLRGEACSLSFFSNGAYTNPMVVRIAGLAYQKGFGGHFHNDNSIGAVREIPGIRIAVPARGDDAARMLRGSIAMAKADGNVVVFLEPIALYHERDLYADGDGQWLTDYPDPSEILLPGEVGVYGEKATDLLIVSYANGLRLSLRAARALERDHGIRARVVDVRWLAPLPHEAIAEHAKNCRRVLVVDECRATGAGIADAVVARLAESRYAGPIASVRAADTYVPLGPATRHVLVTEEQIVEGAVELCR